MSAPVHGILVIDKPVGVTSRDAVDTALRWFPRGAKIGHTGTLDPLASGILVLCLGHATRLAEFVQAMPKEYHSEFTLGARSETDDAEGPLVAATNIIRPDRSALQAVLNEFVGTIEQTPPAYSAARVGGRRAYALARRGRTADLAPRRVQIDQITLIDFEFPKLRLEIRCGKGTYIRSLARDLGERIGCGAYVSELRRCRVGGFGENDAVPLTAEAPVAHANVRPLVSAVAMLPVVTATADEIARLRQGQRIRAAAQYETKFVAVCDSTGGLVAVARPTEDGKELQPDRVIPA
jgi:tRNA pseudouridine55 synthase